MYQWLQLSFEIFYTLRTFNCGVGFNVVVARKDKDEVMNHINQFYDCYEIGTIEKGSSKVKFENRMNWL